MKLAFVRICNGVFINWSSTKESTKSSSGV